MKRNETRTVRAGSIFIGGAHRVAVQSMCATKTQNVDATVEQAEKIREAGGDLVRIAVDSPKDVAALAEIRKQTKANLVVDLQENYRLAATVAPHVDKFRYNPGHLYHHEKEKTVAEKVRFLADVAKAHGCAIRVGVNCGSVDPPVLGAVLLFDDALTRNISLPCKIASTAFIISRAIYFMTSTPMAQNAAA